MSAAVDLFVIGGREGYTPLVGVRVSQLQNARHYLLRAVRELSVDKLDAKPGAARNTIGSILAHLDAAENMFQRITFDGRGFTPEESTCYEAFFEFEGSSLPKGRLLESYLEDLRLTRELTLAGMRTRGDAWLREERTFFTQPSNTHCYGTHYLQDEARHTGQIIIIGKHLIDGAEPEFNPYAPEGRAGGDG